MPNVSYKGQQMPSSPIRKLVPYADAAKARGLKVYQLNIGQPDIETPPLFWENLRTTEMKVLAYCNSDGYASYKQKFAGYYKNLGIDLSADNFIITTGASEALTFAMMSCLDAADEIIIPEPLYANYIGFATSGGLRIKPITTNINDGFALPPISAFEELIGPQTKAILICNPNNPTGYLYTKQELETLRQIVLKHDLFLFVDEVYREFVYDGRHHHSILSLEGLEKNVVVFDSISKRFSACGARIGALISRNTEVLQTAMKFAQARLSPPSLGQLAGQSLFDLPPSFYASVLKEYTQRRDMLIESLRAIPGVVCPNPGGAFYAFVELPIDDADRFCQWLLEDFNHKNQTLMLAPGSGFYSSDGLGKKQVRIAYVLNREDLSKAMDCLRLALETYPGSTNEGQRRADVLAEG